MFQRNQKGVALAFALVLVVALQSTIATMILGMMRHQREVQRITDRNQIAWVREAAIDRSIRTFAYCLEGRTTFLNNDPGTAEPICESYPLRDHITSFWYPGFRNRFPDPLNQIQLSSVMIKDLTGSGDSRQYEIKISDQHLITQVTGAVTQLILITKDVDNNFSIVRQSWSEGPSL